MNTILRPNVFSSPTSYLSLPLTPTVGRLLSTGLALLRVLKGVIMATAMDLACLKGKLYKILFFVHRNTLGVIPLSNSCGHPGYPRLENMDFERNC